MERAILIPDPHNLQRFVEAQNPVYDRVLTELRRGRKTSHWIWFIFPQMRGLGRSATSQEFGIKSLDEARAYLEHPILGPRLRECTRLANDVDQVFGYPDDLKFRSSMTLFAHATADNAEFRAALAKYFDGLDDQQTINLITPA